jgi:Short C-terminal domain
MRGRRVGRPGLLGTMARTAVVAGTATAVSGKVARSQNAKAEQQAAEQEAAQQAAAPPPVAAPEPAAPADDLIAQLERLGALHSQGVLTDEEFAAAKSSLLS